MYEYYLWIKCFLLEWIHFYFFYGYAQQFSIAFWALDLAFLFTWFTTFLESIFMVDKNYLSGFWFWVGSLPLATMCFGFTRIFLLTISHTKGAFVLREWIGMEWIGMEWNGMDWNGMDLDFKFNS